MASISAGASKGTRLGGEAYFDASLGEFLLPYEAVRNAADPDRALLGFLQSTYDAAARLGDWNREALECPQGVPLVPRVV